MSLTQYLKDVKTEMQRVTWPSAKETKNMSLATIGIICGTGFILWALDTGIVAALYALTNLRG